MTREQKLALIIGFSLVLLVGVLVSDHLSGARHAQLADVGAALEQSAPAEFSEQLPDLSDRPTAEESVPVGTIAATSEPEPYRGAITPPLNENDRVAIGHESSADSFLSQLQQQFRESAASAPEAAQLDRSAELPEPRVADPLVADRRPLAVAHYQIKPGDSLWSIAQENYGNGHLAAKLGEYNVAQGRLRDINTIRVGASILLPEPRALGSSARPAGTLAADSAPTPRPRTYTVKRGDTLGEIAQRELGSARRTKAILVANTGLIDDPDDIRVGMVLRLPS